MKKIYVKGKNTLRKAGYTGLISAILTFIVITGAVFFVHCFPGFACRKHYGCGLRRNIG